MATILIVEDDDMLADCYIRWLNASSYDTQHATNVQMALDMIDQQAPDAVLLDILLPGASGVQLLHALRSHADLSTIPIVVSSNTLAENTPELATYGVRDVLNKAMLTRRKLVTSISGVINAAI